MPVLYFQGVFVHSKTRHRGSLYPRILMVCLSPSRIVLKLCFKIDGDHFLKHFFYYIIHYGPGSSVGIASGYDLDGLGSNPGGDEIFCPSRLALGPTQPPIEWVPGLSWG